ncbi:TrmH family RNA methyltransferase [Mammaliicoccus stepanovicii]|uniref:SpoU rRNA Methylase family protein n=1 Tax=Mammaliicoccus stepanovicii TaxID=643214 RepID=A0A239ZM07_9STAP|nr:RNA methyltransferase [Mammaliicoccus stepanovicii]PNZ79225.1 RNA methyltransferase [Mammaliicoccus stepanovicii]GGI41525.1 RNA methyltransferase [Mammaliicoccus stepanovicii]SNV72135.1 SpoU rRNA Methylase family protein [Mammaliicoccus stepanovicii]
MEEITSVQNTKIKQINKLKKKKERTKQGQFLIEGFHLIEEAYNSGLKIMSLLLVDPSRIDEKMIEYAEEVYTINFKVAEALSDTTTPQGVFAVVELPSNDVSTDNQVLVLDRVQDPGNMGALIRNADAAGMDAVMYSKGCADPYQDKVLRASQGSVFHLPVIEVDLESYLNGFDGNVFGTSLEDAVNYQTINKQDKFALIMGNEGSGVEESLLKQTTQNLNIPLYGKAESLNVAVSCGILLYHLKG